MSKKPTQKLTHKPVEHTTKRQSINWAWAVVIAAIAFVLVFRLRLINIPLERDEGEFGYMGQLILQGIPPYKLAYNMKMPGIYAAYALVMALFGQSPAGIHIGLLLINIASIIMMFLLVRKLFGQAAGAGSAAAYAVLSGGPWVLGTSAHATHYVVVCALGALLVLLKAQESGRRWLYVWSGVLFGLAFLMKQPGGVFGIFAAIFVIWEQFRQRREKQTGWIGRGAGAVGALAAGGILPIALTFIILKMAGVFSDFWFWTIQYSRQYGSIVPIGSAPRYLAMAFTSLIHDCWPIWALAVAGVAALLANRDWRRHWPFAVGLLLFSFLGTCPGFYFRDHYFVVLLPAVAMFAGLAAGWAMNLARSGKAPAYLLVAVWAVALVSPVYARSDFFFTMSPEQVCRDLYGANPFIEAPAIADYVRKHTNKDDTVAIFGSEPEIYFYSGRHSATGYIYTYPLVEDQPFALRMQKAMIREVERAKPKYVVMVAVSTSWLRNPASPSLLFDWYQSKVARHYEDVGLVDIFSDYTGYYWDYDALGRTPSSRFYVVVSKRK